MRSRPAALAAARLGRAASRGCGGSSAGGGGRVVARPRPRPPTSPARSAATAPTSTRHARPERRPARPRGAPERRRRRSPAPTLVIRSGGDVDAWLEDAIDSAGSRRAASLTLLDHVAAPRASTRTGGRTRATACAPSPRSRAALAKADPGRRRRLRGARAAPTRRLERARHGGRLAASTEIPRAAAQARHHARRARLLRRAATACGWSAR